MKVPCLQTWKLPVELTTFLAKFRQHFFPIESSQLTFSDFRIVLKNHLFFFKIYKKQSKVVSMKQTDNLQRYSSKTEWAKSKMAQDSLNNETNGLSSTIFFENRIG